MVGGSSPSGRSRNAVIVRIIEGAGIEADDRNMTSSRDEPTSQSKPGAATEWVGVEVSAGERAKYVGWIVLVAYSLVLLGRAIYQSRGSGTTAVSIWELQDSRRLLEWIGGLVLGAFWEFALFVPLGFCAGLVVVSHRAGRLGRLAARFCPLMLASGIALLILAAGTAGGWDATTVLGWIFPLLGCLLGTWMGTTWRRGRRARFWLLPKIAVPAVLAVLCFGILGWLSLEPAPLPFEAARVTSAEKRRLVREIRSKSPTSLEEGQTQTLRLTEHDLNALLSWGLSLGSPQRKAQVRLARDVASLSVSARVPLGAEGPRYLNVVMTGGAGITDGSLRLEVDRCQVGSLEVPRWVLRPALFMVRSLVRHDRRSKLFLEATRRMAVEPNALELTYGPVRVPPDLRRTLFRPAGVSEEVLASTQTQVDHLLAVAPSLPRAQLSFGWCFETAFALARERSLHSNPIVENRAAVFALGTLLGHRRVGEFLGSIFPEDDDPALRGALYRVTLRGRSDWTKHFCVSAVIAILSDAAVSDAAGLLKEELDADTGGSGFSFGDLIADRAGTVFGACATRDEASARALQDRLARGFRVDEFFPPAADLPEGIPDAELQSRYGGVGGERYRHLVEEIERRVAACAAYH